MNDKPTIEVGKVPIITKFIYTLGVLPTSYLMSMTYQEQVTWLCNYIQQTLIPQINEDVEAIQELQNLYELLRTYVNDYFDNLDVQEEINNKLDEMVSDGTIDDIIINKTPFPELENRVENIENSSLTELVVVGDSYSALDLSTWAEDTATQLNLNLHKSAQSGLGYTRETEANTFFIDLLNRFIDNVHFPELFMSETLRNKTKYVITYGGINDYASTETALATAVETYCNRAKELFPNAQIIIVGPQMAIADVNKIRNLTIVKGLSKGAMSAGCSYTDAREWLINTPYQYTTLYSSDNLHPSAKGYKIITSKMLNLIAGNNSVTDEITFEFNSDRVTNGEIEIKRIQESLIIHVIANGTFTNDSSIKIGTFTTGGSKFFIENKRYPVYKRDSNNCPSSLLGGIFIGSGANFSVINNSGSDYTGGIIASFVVPIASYKVTL